MLGYFDTELLLFLTFSNNIFSFLSTTLPPSPPLPFSKLIPPPQAPTRTAHPDMECPGYLTEQWETKQFTQGENINFKAIFLDGSGLLFRIVIRRAVLILLEIIVGIAKVLLK